MWERERERRFQLTVHDGTQFLVPDDWNCAPCTVALLERDQTRDPKDSRKREGVVRHKALAFSQNLAASSKSSLDKLFASTLLKSDKLVSYICLRPNWRLHMPLQLPQPCPILLSSPPRLYTHRFSLVIEVSNANLVLRPFNSISSSRNSQTFQFFSIIRGESPTFWAKQRVN